MVATHSQIKGWARLRLGYNPARASPSVAPVTGRIGKSFWFSQKGLHLFDGFDDYRKANPSADHHPCLISSVDKYRIAGFRPIAAERPWKLPGVSG